MPRYFLEVAYKGTNYSGFQKQANACTIQSEIENALHILYKERFELTGSSRTDAGVHALQNFFHFDIELDIQKDHLYNLNAILPSDIVAKSIIPVNPEAHCRFHAISRDYKYFIYNSKDPFQEDKAFFYPYAVDIKLLQKAAEIIKAYHNFKSFSKRNTQVKTFNCIIEESYWIQEKNGLIYCVKANRFLRGMVKALVGTMLKVGRYSLSIDEFKYIIESHNCMLADFSVSSKGLFLITVNYPDYFFSH